MATAMGEHGPFGSPGERRTGLEWRVPLSIVTFFGMLCFLLLYLALWAPSYTAVQSAVIVLVTILAFVGINGAAWASYGIRQSRWS